MADFSQVANWEIPLKKSLAECTTGKSVAQLPKGEKNRSRDLGDLLEIQKRISFWTDFLAQIILKHHHSGGQHFTFSTPQWLESFPLPGTSGMPRRLQAIKDKLLLRVWEAPKMFSDAWRGDFLKWVPALAPQNFRVDPPHKIYTKNVKTTNNTYIVCFGEVYLQQIIFTWSSRSFCRKIGFTGNHQHVKIAKCLAKLIPLLSMGEKV